MKSTYYFLRKYVRSRSLFLSVLRAKEAYLYQGYLPFRKPVLDYGCGDGVFATIAFKSGIDVGLDMFDSRINEAKKQKVYKNVVGYDGRVIPFKDNHFGTVISNSVLEHVEGLSNALSEISRVLKPKGRFITTVMTNKWEEYLFGAKIFGNAYRKYMRKKQVHLNLLTKKEWDSRFNAAGFKIDATIGHLDRKTSGLIDLLHYVSVPNLISYKLTGKWVPIPALSEILIPMKLLIELTSKNTKPEESSGLFYVLSKK